MKTIQELIDSEPVFLHEFTDQEGVFTEFSSTRWSSSVKLADESEQHEGERILFASYSTGGYEGDAFVLGEKDGKLFEVNAGHCSCYGLEGQWDPEETTVEALMHRLTVGELGTERYSCAGNEFADELMKFIGMGK